MCISITRLRCHLPTTSLLCPTHVSVLKSHVVHVAIPSPSRDARTVRVNCISEQDSMMRNASSIHRLHMHEEHRTRDWSSCRRKARGRCSGDCSRARAPERSAAIHCSRPAQESKGIDCMLCTGCISTSAGIIWTDSSAASSRESFSNSSKIEGGVKSYERLGARVAIKYTKL